MAPARRATVAEADVQRLARAAARADIDVAVCVEILVDALAVAAALGEDLGYEGRPPARLRSLARGCPLASGSS